jgi:hypothetical protein
MSKIQVKSERVVNAKPEAVYDVIKDYKEKRPLFLTPNFLDYQVEKGGSGDGTVVNYRLQAARRERPYRMQVNELVKGQAIQERDANSSLVTTWMVAPIVGGQQSKVSVVTDWEGGQGVGGFFERTFAPLGLSRIYDRMLDQLTPLVQSDTSVNVAQKRGPSVPVLLVAAGAACVVGIAIIRKVSK